MTDDSIIRVETKIAYLEEAVDELNRVVLKQEKSMRELQTLCAQLVAKLKAHADPPQGGMPTEERPPHF
jgi:SlyX protein